MPRNLASSNSASWSLRGGALYVALIAGSLAGMWVIGQAGERLFGTAIAPATGSKVSATPAASELLLHVLLALAAVIAAGQMLGPIFRWLGQPPVIGEVVAGILLGPSLLGRIWPAGYAYLLPASAELDIRPVLGAIAQLGVILYMFVVGLELDTSELRRRGQAAIFISHAGIALPLLFGGLLALVIYPSLAPADVPFSVFALFLGVAMAITAFPVLARILTDQRMTQTPLGSMALTCAAIGDVTAWCLLAFVVGVVQARLDRVASMVPWTLGYLAVMTLAVRPLLSAWSRQLGERPLGPGVLAMSLVGLLLSALTTEWIGIHALFGAFAFGACIPHDSGLARQLTKQIETLVLALFLPAFFAFIGMRTNIGLVQGIQAWLICGLIIAVATFGKFGGTLFAAKLTGQSWRDASALGILMNTRGLMELIVLNVGFELKVISPTLFAMMVLMALVTTIATTPILRRLVPPPPVKA